MAGKTEACGSAGARGGAAGAGPGALSVIVVPWHPHEATEEELAGLKTIARFATGAELVVATPDASSLPPFICPDRVEVFPAYNFESFLANNRLMTSVAFYERFERYQQMALVHCDVYLFKPLEPLLKTLYPYSYVGAPWLIKQPDGSYVDEGVGNGGFSLRRIPHFLEVLRGSPAPRWPQYTTFRRGAALWVFLWGCKLLGLTGERVSHFLNRHAILEDVFWAKVATCYSKRYTVAPTREALKLGYETSPSHAHALNGSEIPYGFHAWQRNGGEFAQTLAKQAGGTP